MWRCEEKGGVTDEAQKSFMANLALFHELEDTEWGAGFR